MQPTVGRIVYYKAYGTPGGEFKPGAERAAIITQIYPDSYESEVVDLCVLNPTGMFFNQRVPRDTNGAGGTWDWMPYQKGQAAKTDALKEKETP